MQSTLAIDNFCVVAEEAAACQPGPYGWLHAVMLRVMRDHGEWIAPACAAMFSRSPAAHILRFLDEHASPLDVLAIMASLPAPLFAATALEMAVGRGRQGREKEGERERTEEKDALEQVAVDLSVRRFSWLPDG